jgi:hypothetical protein
VFKRGTSMKKSQRDCANSYDVGTLGSRIRILAVWPQFLFVDLCC